MIFVTLGTQKFQLDRLLKQLDDLCEEGRIREEIFAQTGHSSYRPKHYKYTDFLDRDAFERKMRESSLVITHSGVGSIITAINAGKPVIVYPRLHKYKEHVDDHQLEIAQAFSKKNFVLCCEETDDLATMIAEAKEHKFDKYISSTDKIIAVVKNVLEDTDMNHKKEIRIIIVTHKEYEMPTDPMYLPVCVGPQIAKLKEVYQPDNTGENISDKNSLYSELTALYWAWKNLDSDYIGLAHYRRYMAKGSCHSLREILSEEQALQCLAKKDVLAVRKRWYPETIKNHFINASSPEMHPMILKQMDLLDQTIQDLYPEYLPDFHKVINGHSAHMFNMFVMSKEDLELYCEWLFSVLFEAEKRIRQEKADSERMMGCFSEFLLDTWLKHNQKSVYGLRLYHTEMNLWKQIKRFLRRRFSRN